MWKYFIRNHYDSPNNFDRNKYGIKSLRNDSPVKYIWKSKARLCHVFLYSTKKSTKQRRRNRNNSSSRGTTTIYNIYKIGLNEYEYIQYIHQSHENKFTTL